MSTDARSYLFVPGNRPERFDKALASGADAVVFDLEDAVAPADKQAAREAIAGWLRAAAPAAHGRVVVRINDAASAAFADDLAMLAGAARAVVVGDTDAEVASAASLPKADTPACATVKSASAASPGLRRTAATAPGTPAASVQVMLAKAESPQQVTAVRAALPCAPVLALIESARGVAQVDAIAAAEGVARLLFGTLDFALDLGVETGSAPLLLDHLLSHAASRIAIASRVAGLAAPVAGVTPEIDDETALLADLALARRHGFGAKLCIHPKQVAPIHAALLPSDAELDWARRALAAEAASPGVARLDGRMVDRPVVLRAQQLLNRARR